MEINFEKTKVLLVDDDTNYGFSLKMLLGKKGLNIEHITNPKEALEKLKNSDYDMILLDYYMPEMTGEEFLKEFRQFNRETIVFLQTAYAEEKPELEMLDTLNIQGYIDKNKEPDEIFLAIVSGIKMSDLIKKVKEKEQEIEVLNYKKSIVGNLITNLVNEAKDQLFQISGMNESIKNDTDKYFKQNEIIKEATEKTYELYEALNFESERDINILKLKKTIEKLLKATLLLNNTNLSFEIEDENVIIKEVASDLIYLIIKTIDLLINKDIKDIVLKVKKTDGNIIFEIKSNKDLGEINIQELEYLNKTILVKLNGGIIIIQI